MKIVEGDFDDDDWVPVRITENKFFTDSDKSAVDPWRKGLCDEESEV